MFDLSSKIILSSLALKYPLKVIFTGCHSCKNDHDTSVVYCVNN